MGKKSKRQGGASKATPGAVLNSKAVCKAVEDLASVTQGGAHEIAEPLWRDFDAIQSATKVLREKQGPPQVKLPPRSEGFPVFEQWLRENGADYDSVEVAQFPGLDYGLRATRDLQVEEKVLIIPQKLMMTSKTALDGPLGKLVVKDRMLQAMPNVVLALHLLNEMFSGTSFWKAYIDVLPHTYSTPLFYSKQELQSLQASPCLVKSLMQLRNISKLYAHLHRMIRTYTDVSFPLHASGFCYDDFLWAVSCVMSRQNEIPVGEGQRGETALAMIPLWDLANHCNGQMSTFFNLDSKTCDCFAPHFTRKGTEFRIFYGPRTNADLFVHQGFVYPANESDLLQIKLGLSAKEESKTKAMKTEVLKRIELPISGMYFLRAVDCPFPPPLKAFVRVFTASQPELEHYLSLNLPQLRETLTSHKWRQSDKRTLDFLEKRCSLLLRPYKTSPEEDDELLRSGKLSPYSFITVQLRSCEKRILIFSEGYARRGLQGLADHASAAHDELKLTWGRFSSEGATGGGEELLLPDQESEEYASHSQNGGGDLSEDSSSDGSPDSGSTHETSPVEDGAQISSVPAEEEMRGDEGNVSNVVVHGDEGNRLSQSKAFSDSGKDSIHVFSDEGDQTIGNEGNELGESDQVVGDGGNELSESDQAPSIEESQSDASKQMVDDGEVASEERKTDIDSNAKDDQTATAEDGGATREH